MRYVSTRGRAPAARFCDILLEGLATDGGLYLPEAYPRIDAAEQGLEALGYVVPNRVIGAGDPEYQKPGKTPVETAREAIQVIGNVLEEYGYGRNGEFVGMDVKTMRTQKPEVATKHLRNSLAVFLRLVITRLKAAPDKPLAETLALVRVAVGS